jgi:hypothetical protein
LRAAAWAVCACLLAASASAEAGPGPIGAEFLRIGVGPRAVALGEAYTGLAEGSLALAYNPAGPAFLRRQELSLAHDEYASGVRHEWAAYSHPTPWGTLSAAANLLLVEAFESYDAFDRPSGETSAQEGAYQLGYAAALSPALSIGGTGSLVTSRLHQREARTLTGAGGVLWRPHRSLSLGAAALHLGPGLRHVSQTADLPLTLRAGLAWTPLDPNDFSHYFTVSADAVKVRGDGNAVRGGLELWYDHVLALRAGGRSDSDTGPGYSLGMGARLRRGDEKRVEVEFDYAFTDSGELAKTHRVGLTLRFGETLTDNAWSEVFRRRGLYEEDAPRRRRAPRASRDEAPPAPRPRAEVPGRLPGEYENWINP